jgi:hypothetical protein
MRTTAIHMLLALLALATGPLAMAQRSDVPTEQVSFVYESIALAGVARGEVLRVSVFNPHPAQDGLSKTIILTERGATLYESELVRVAPLHTVYFDIAADDPALDPVRGPSGRSQFAVKVKFPWLPGAGPRAAEPFLAAHIEVWDNVTGKASSNIVMKGRKILEN